MSRPWIVLKFGGTSVASAESWSTVAKRARDLLPEQRVWIVASAVAGVTDLLETAIDDALGGRAGEALSRLEERHRELRVEVFKEGFQCFFAPVFDLGVSQVIGDFREPLDHSR